MPSRDLPPPERAVQPDVEPLLSYRVVTNTLSICLVDDSADYRLLVEKTLRHQLPHCRILSFGDGQTLLNELLQMGEKPNLIILDQHMPKWSGHQTLMALKQHPAHRSIPVVMMSMDATHSEINNFYQAGAAIFLRKSMDFNILKENLLLAYQYASKPKPISE